VSVFHADLLRRYEEGAAISRPQLCGWSSAVSQEARFSALMRSLRYGGGSIVDYGCGTGDLHAFILREFGQVHYTGLDPNESMLAVARLAHDTRFARCDFDEVEFEPADYVVASGIFQFQDNANPAYYKALAKALFEKARIAFAANFLSSLRPDSEKIDSELYLHPKDISELAASLSPSWAVDHSYHPGFGDVTIAAFHTAENQSWARPRVDRV